MKTKIILFLLMLSATTFAQNTEWLVFNESNSGLSSNWVKAIDFDEDKAMMGTISGLSIYNSGNWEVYNTSNSALQDNYVSSIRIDNIGTKWIGTTNGLLSINNNLNDKGWNMYNDANSSLPSNNITAIAIDDDNKKWIGTWGGGLAVLNNNIWQIFNTSNSPLPANGIYDIKIDNNNNVWIATHGGGIAKYSNNVWQIFNTNNSNLQSNIIFSIDFDQQSNIWLGTELGLVKFNGNNQWTLYNSSNTAWNFSAVMCVAYDKFSQKIYFGTYNGMGIYSNGNFSFKTKTNSNICYNWVSAISIDDDGNKWIGTLGGGLSIFNENGVTLPADNNYFRSDNFEISSYPNPATNYLEVKLDLQKSSSISMKIFDSTGKLQKIFNTETLSSGVNTIKYNLEDIKPGIYFYRFETDFGIKTSRLIKI